MQGNALKSVCERYFVNKIVLTYCNQEKLLKFEADGRKFAKNFISLEQFIQRVKGQNNFWKQNAFLTYSWRLEQLEFKLEKIIGI